MSLREQANYTKRSFSGNAPAKTVIGYLRVSTAEQADSGAGMGAQRAAIQAEADRRGWDVTWIEDAGYSAKDLKRPGVLRALDLLQAGKASALVVAKLDRLSRSLLDFAGLMAQAEREGWALVALDAHVDTSTPAGELLTNVLASFAQFERRLIGQRTRDALAQRKAAGVRLGRPVCMPEAVRLRISMQRREGDTLQTIADGLNRDRIPTARGGTCWRPSSVKAVLDSMELDSH